MKKLCEIDVIRENGFDIFEGEIVYGNRYFRVNSLNRYLLE